jgi:transposase-like protein
MSSNKITWNDENTATLSAAVEGLDLVSQEVVSNIAKDMGGSTRSVGAKLRKLGFEVEKASAKASAWTPEMEDELRNFLAANEATHTYAEIAQVLFSGAGITDKQVQGKILSMELTGSVKPTPKREAKRTYTPEQEVVYVEMALANESLEAIAEALGVSVVSARGKGLSLVREGRLDAQPVQATSTAARRKDPLDGLDIAGSTLEALCEATNMSARGLKNMLTRRGISCQDHDGAKKRATLDAKKDVAA